MKASLVKNNPVKRIGAIALALSLLLSFSACEGSYLAESDAGNGSSFQTIDDLAYEKIGTISGFIGEMAALAYYPNAEIEYFNTLPDAIVALEQGKIAAVVLEDFYYYATRTERNDLKMLEGNIDSLEVNPILDKTMENSDLRYELDEFITKGLEDGTVAALRDKWMEHFGEFTEISGYTFSGEKGVLTFALDPENPPCSYYAGENLVGFEIELFTKFCQDYGYEPEFVPAVFSAIIAGLEGGKYDVGLNFCYTEERGEKVYFCESYLEDNIVAVVYEPEEETDGFWNGIKSSFAKTFLSEARWKLFLQGIGRTAVITVSSVAGGTVLGILLYLAYYMSRAGKRLVSILNWIVSRTPMVVMLMIMFYIVFGKSSIAPVFVAIIVFIITFGSTVFGLLNTGVSAIGIGQFEGAKALGYTKSQTLFKVLMPQGIRLVRENYTDAIVSMIKDSSVVGYITIQDLTKISDIVRSRTYEAFFPLITSALIYIVLIEIVIFLVRNIGKRSDRRKSDKSRIMKGVEQHD